MTDLEDLLFISGTSHPQLAERIGDQLGIFISHPDVTLLANDTQHIRLNVRVKSRKVVVMQTLSQPVSSNLMELLLTLGAIQASGASEIHAIIPYFPFQNARDFKRTSVPAKLVAELIKTAGATQLTTIMLHPPQVESFFPIPANFLTTRPFFVSYFQSENLSDTVVAGNLKQGEFIQKLAGELRVPFVLGYEPSNLPAETQLLGNLGEFPEGKRRAILYTHEIVTGESVLGITKALLAAGIEEISVACTHGVFAPFEESLKKFENVPEISEVLTTDTVPIHPDKVITKLRILTVAPILADVIHHAYFGRSVGSLFAFDESMAGDPTTDAPPPDN